MQDATGRFSNRVADYVRARPAYPPAIVDVLRERIGLSPAWTVADVGAGTGISSRPFLDAGHRVVAVEPNAAMRDAMTEALRGNDRFRAVDGTAEGTMLADRSVDLVVAAQAFHWFDRAAFKRECRRVLRPNGAVALMWNERRLGGTPFLDGYERLLHRHATDYAKVDHRNIGDADLSAFFSPANYETATTTNVVRHDLAGLRARLLSSSYVPPIEDPRADAMLTDLVELFDKTQRDGAIEMVYDTNLYFGRTA